MLAEAVSRGKTGLSTRNNAYAYYVTVNTEVFTLQRGIELKMQFEIEKNVHTGLIL